MEWAGIANIFRGGGGWRQILTEENAMRREDVAQPGHINVLVRRQHVDTLTKTNWPRRRKLRAMEMMVGDFSAKTRQIDFTPRQCPER